ncbi:MAG: ketoacyl-ACP synthase III [Planctomycetota bacterium]|nr:ketoacyl-ACP synthase III [Planctomycetota bacterium]MDA1221223.1 ketoacyl-ACP synthase III [Planctomycetota bacterium]
MTSLIPVGISGMGRYVPERRVPNAEFESLLDTSDEWISQRTGIHERRYAREDELTSDMGAAAAREAIADAGLTPDDIDLIICCTVTPDYPFPATACQIGHKIGAERAGGYDLMAACSGWVLGAFTASQFVATGAMRHVLVVGVEKLSSVIDFEDRTTCVIFADGAGATVFSPLEFAKRGEYLHGGAGMRGGTEDILSIPAGGTRLPASAETVAKRQHFIHMEGRQVFRFAVNTFADLVRKCVEGHTLDDLGLVVPHQVNMRIIESAASQVGISLDQVFVNIDRYGNTSAASVPIALYEAREAGRLVEGKIVSCVAFGGGLTWGHVALRW